MIDMSSSRNSRHIIPLSLLVLLFLFGLLSSRNDEQPKEQVLMVYPVVETTSSKSDGDVDDSCFWIHPSDPSQSVLIGTDKEYGIAVYDLDGNEIQFIEDGPKNNVDIRYQMPLGDQIIDLVCAGNHSQSAISFYRMDPDTRTLQPIESDGFSIGIEVYGSCLYRSPRSGKFFAFVNSKSGEVEQWELGSNSANQLTGKLVRTLKVDSQPEGCVADDDLAVFYLGEEAVGIWKFDAEPDASPEGTLIDRIGTYLTADVEGLTILYGENKTGYLIASSQGSDRYVVYDRQGDHAYRFSFQIVASNDIDGTQETDGIDITGVPHGEQFPHGVFAAQDGSNEAGAPTNFKLVPLGIPTGIPLASAEFEWKNPRQ